MNAVASKHMNSIFGLRPPRPAKTSVNSIRPMPGASVAAEGQAPQPSNRRDAPGAEHPPSHHWGKSPLPAALLLAVIPLVLFGGPAAVSRPTAPVPVKPVQVEGVRVIRMDATTFRGRWMPINDMPPATVIHEVQLKGGDALSQEITGKPVEVARPPPAVRIVKRAALRQDICSKHGMHRVTVMRGKWQGWRCRR
jgi:uncharacterized protein YceK